MLGSLESRVSPKFRFDIEQIITTQHPCEQLRGTSLFVFVGNSDVLFYGDLVGIKWIVPKQLDWEEVQQGPRCLFQSLQSDLTVETLSWASWED